MKVLIIGFGSIGKRHYEVLSQMSQIQAIDLVTRQRIEGKVCYENIYQVTNISQYDYFVIATETNKHFDQLRFLEENLDNKLIFCEKPLFSEKMYLNIQNNKVFVGYVLRFHPLLKKLKDIVKNEQIIMIAVKAGQYLPTWRPNIDYRNCYSAKKEEGGGVLLDLSHEIDYVQWLCGNIQILDSINTKISDLEINTEDLTILIGKADNNSIVNISIDYISKIIHRELILETLESSYKLDLISNKLIKRSKTGLEEIYSFSNLHRNYMFEKMHESIFKEQEGVCTFEEGLRVMDIISAIQGEK